MPTLNAVEPFPPVFFFKKQIFKLNPVDFGLLPVKFDFYDISPYYLNNMIEAIV